MPFLLIPAGNPSAWTGPTGNNTYLFRGHVPTLIDAGVGNPDHIDAVASELGGRPLAQILITHGHPDHVGGVPALLDRWPDAAIRQFASGLHPIRGGEVIPAGDTDVVAIHTPGHSPDHCCFLQGQDLFCGDLARLGGTVVIPAGRGGDLAQYLESLHRVRAMRPRRLLPGHGPAIDDPDAVLDEYIRHRAEREEQIVEALQAEGKTPEEIVRRVYTGLDPALVSAAVESVTAHLIKLRNEGRVRERDGVWSLGR
jgi:glyoxylase-like metal-dependent hydrolase (beta-lactamase superfamily II)